MWEEDLPDPHALLRQGDLLRDVPFTLLKEEPVADAQGRAHLRVKEFHAVVVSQCCSTQQRGVAELAAVARTRSLPETSPMVRGLLSKWPAEEGDVFVDGMLLEPVGGVIAEPTDGRYPHALFRTRVTYTDDLEWLQHKRVARMTPVGRRNLRLRLGAWYARTEEGDAAALEDIGQFTGLHDQQIAARYRPSSS